MKYTKDIFIQKAKEVHDNKYDYSKVEYKGSQTKVCIICPEHGEFWQTPASHIRGYCCPKCANFNRGSHKRWSLEEFIQKAKEVHGDKYDYSKTNYVNNNTPVCIVCPEHGEFWQLPLIHIFHKSGCPKCAGRDLNTEEIIKLFKEKHGNKYDYSKVEYVKMHTKVCIICPEHGEFWQTPSKHLLGQGCPKCGKISSSNKQKMTTEEFIEKARKVHGDKYDYSKTVYNISHDEVTIICPKHGEFKQVANYHLCGHGCSLCGNNISLAEDEITNFIKNYNIAIKEKDRKILNNRKEIDIFVPEYNIGIEFDGLYWHDDKYKDKKYHLNKTIECEKKGIKLIHIFEDEWRDKKEIIKSMISLFLNKSNTTITANNCHIGIVDKYDKIDFLNKNNIFGNINSDINIGLYYNRELVYIMTFKKNKKNTNEYELLRFCSKLNTFVINAFEALLNFFIVNYKPEKIVAYANRRWPIIDIFEKNGFIKYRYIKPNFYYIEGNNRNDRIRYKKIELIKRGIKETKKEYILKNNISKIYDCGLIYYVWGKQKITHPF